LRKCDASQVEHTTTIKHSLRPASSRSPSPDPEGIHWRCTRPSIPLYLVSSRVMPVDMLYYVLYIVNLQHAIYGLVGSTVDQMRVPCTCKYIPSPRVQNPKHLPGGSPFLSVPVPCSSTPANQTLANPHPPSIPVHSIMLYSIIPSLPTSPDSPPTLSPIPSTTYASTLVISFPLFFLPSLFVPKSCANGLLSLNHAPL